MFSKFIRLSICFAVAIICIVPAMIFAQTDSTSIVNELIKMIPAKYHFVAFIITTILSIATPIIYRWLQIKYTQAAIKFKWLNSKIAISIKDRILSWIFGRSCLMYNSQVITDGLSEEHKQAAQAAHLEMIKEHFLKHDPLLSIDVKKI